MKAFKADVKDAFASARQDAIDSANVPKQLKPIYAELGQTLKGLADLHGAGKISAEQYAVASGYALAQAREKALKAGEALGKQEIAAKKLKEQYRTLAGALGATAGPVLSLVRMGLAGTAQGEQMAIQFQRVSREVANIFLPTINATVGAITRLADWFRSLSGSQQDLISKFAMMTAGALGFAVILPRVAGGLVAIGSVMKALAAHPFLAITSALLGLVLSTDEGQSAFKELWKALAPIGEALGDIFLPLLNLLRDIARTVADFLGPAFKELGNLIDTVIVKPLNFVRDLLGLPSRREREQAAGRQPGGRGRDHRELDVRGGGMEAMAATWARLQTAANRTDFAQRTREEQLATQRDMAVSLRQIANRPPGGAAP